MAVRTAMNSLVAYTRSLMPSVSTTDVPDVDIQTELDTERVLYDYVRLAHDADYRIYVSNSTHPPKNEVVRATLAGTRLEYPDFSYYYAAGFFDQAPTLRDGVTEETVAYTPNLSDCFGGTFLFSTTPEIELYLYAYGYNPFRAAANILERNADTGGRPLKSVSRGRISYSYADTDKQIANLLKRGYYINRPIPRWERR